MKVNVNGLISDSKDAVVSVLDHGFLFGEGVYETVRTYNRNPFVLDRHLFRLRKSAHMINLLVPLSDEQFNHRISETISKSKAIGELSIRIILTRGPGELSYDPTRCPDPSVVIIVTPLREMSSQTLNSGIIITFSTFIRNHPMSINPQIKSNNLLNNALAMQEALKQGLSETLMRNYKGQLVECAQSNFFIVKSGEVITPPITAGLLAGVTRNLIFEIGALSGVPVREEILFETDLDSAQEAFLTSTTREIIPVTRVGKHTIGNGNPGPITRTLMSNFSRLVNQLI